MSTSASLGSFICEMRGVGPDEILFGALKFSDLKSFPRNTELTGPTLINSLSSEEE